MRRLLYFGRLSSPGHYLYVSEDGPVARNPTELLRHTGISLESPVKEIFWKIDGGYTPKGTLAQGACAEAVVPPFRILAWHDYTGDKRSGSNSALLGIGYLDAADMQLAAWALFPSVMKRQTSLLTPAQ